MSKRKELAETSSPQQKKLRGSSFNKPHICEGDSGSVLSEKPLWCFICLNVFTDPVTTSCGHNFCKSCLTQCLETTEHCPLCEKKFKKNIKKIDKTLREAVDQFKKKSYQDKPEIICIACQQTALKSCVDCGVTYCESHLRPHYIGPILKEHKLIRPVENLKDYICQKHNRPLEMFCKDDNENVCQLCTVKSHNNHNIVYLEEVNKERKTQLALTQEKVQQMIRERLKKIHKISHSVNSLEKYRQNETGKCTEVFTSFIRNIEGSQVELLQINKEQCDTVKEQAKEFIKDIVQEISILKECETELHQHVNSEEHLNPQRYPSICSPPISKDWTDIRIDTDLGGITWILALSQLQKSLNEKLDLSIKKTVIIELKRIQQYAVNVTLDPDTANQYLILSNDEKEVRCGNKMKDLPDTPERFTFKYSIVLGKQSFSSGRFYFEVQVSGKNEWGLGVAKTSVNRKGKINLRPLDGFWTVRLRNGSTYEACAGPNISLSLKQKPHKIGVFVDYEKGQVSFYDVGSKSHMYSFTGQNFTEKLYPYFCPGSNDSGKNPASMIITSVSNTD